MGWVAYISGILLSSVEASSQMALASEELKQASFSSQEVYVQALLAALSTLLVMGVLWMIIFRPKFKSSQE
ncbi:hypothetical protein [Proteiniclasticum ruminis]|uniref:Uncharacterized protein n=1 Tax=Proteiniclasticum ruminis TaxID=398199 RepID=A0A1I5CU69_9CLOT|nr:hypothetical protein [Proteiniclasticum ruminis]SFN90520.1 hypothetical protein SAMN04488695_10756 [Proteiniclasticum ruminis]